MDVVSQILSNWDAASIDDKRMATVAVLSNRKNWSDGVVRSSGVKRPAEVVRSPGVKMSAEVVRSSRETRVPAEAKPRATQVLRIHVLWQACPYALDSYVLRRCLCFRFLVS